MKKSSLFLLMILVIGIMQLRAQTNTTDLKHFEGIWVNHWYYENLKKTNFIRINIRNGDISVREKSSLIINDEKSPRLSYKEFSNVSFNGNNLSWFWQSVDEDGVYGYHYAATIKNSAMSVNEKCYKGRRLLYSTNTVYYNEKDDW